MVEQDTKFTVIIPTRERADTLYYCLKTVTAQKYPHLDILVSDNFSQDNTKAVVASFDDPRITYINTGERLSMSHNWEFALNHVKDGWVMILGDDDGVLPGALARLNEIIKKTGAKAISSRQCHYCWPSYGFKTNRLLLPLPHGHEQRNSAKWLKKLMSGRTTYQNLPLIYTGGLADISVINAARDDAGIFFKSRTPDVYSAIAIASVIPKYLYLGEPIFIAGLSGHSTGFASLGYGNNKKASELYYSEDNIPFYPKLGHGKVKSVPFLVYESYLQALHLHKDKIMVDLKYQLALTIARATHENRSAIIDYCGDVAQQNELVFSEILTFAERLRRKLKGAKVLPLLRDHFTTIELDPRPFNVTNVEGAAILATAFYLRKREFNNIMLKRLRYLPNRIAEYLKR